MTEWRKVKLGDILDFYNGKAIKSSSGIIPIYGANGVIGRTNRPLYNNAIIIGRVGAYCGSVAFCEKDFWASDNTIVTKPKDDNNTLFFYYLLDTMDLNKYAGGSAQPLLTQTTLKSLETYIPCANVQRRIAEVLSRYDALIENYQRQIKLLEEAAQRLYKEWFVDLRFPGHQSTPIINNLPQSWQKKKLGEILVFFDKKRKPLSSMQRMSMEKNFPYYGAATLMDYVDDYLFDGIYLLLGEDGTVITPENYPVLQYVWGKFWVNNHAHVLRGTDGISTEYLYMMFKEMPISDVVTGAAQPKISQGRLSEKSIILPSIELIQKWSSITKPFFDSIRNKSEQIRNLSEARDRLLPKLMSAEIEVLL